MAVHPSVKATSVRELISLAKSRNEPLRYASGGIGSSQHLATGLLGHMAGIKLIHVPYKGGALGLVDVIGGHLDMMMSPILTVVPHAKAGRLRALGVTTAKRNTVLPDLPTIAEAVPGYESVAWYGMVAPAGLPPAVLSKLSAEVIKSTRSSDMYGALVRDGAEPVGSTPREFAAFIKAETNKYAQVVKEADLRSE